MRGYKKTPEEDMSNLALVLSILALIATVVKSLS